MHFETFDGVETLVGGEHGAPFELYNDKIVRQYFYAKVPEDSTMKEMETAAHIAFICEYRRTLPDVPKERYEFYRWVIHEYKRLVDPDIVCKDEGNRLVIVQHIHNYQEDYFLDMAWKLYTFVKTEYFLSHAEDAFWIADNYDSHDMYEMICEVDSPESEEVDSDFIQAWLHDKGYETEYLFIDKADVSKENLQVKDPTSLEARALSFWKERPIYKGDVRQCLIHERLRAERLQQEKLEKEKEVQKKLAKKNKQKKRRHR